MKRLCAFLLLALVLLPAAVSAQSPQSGSPAQPGQPAADEQTPITADQKPAIDAAKAWLAGIDAGGYGRSWKDAAAYFRGTISQKDWETALTAFRKPLGALGSRQPTRAKSLTSLEGAPDGTYVVMEFATTFANKKTAFETVAFSREQDGTWRAVGYFIR